MKINKHVFYTVIIGVVLFCVVLVAGCASDSTYDPIHGNWYYSQDENGIKDAVKVRLEFYDNGLGTAYYYIDKGILSASDFGLDGYIKTMVFDFQYKKVSDNYYKAIGTSVYVESYIGQSLYGGEGSTDDFGTFRLVIKNKYTRNLVWDWNGEVDTYSRIKSW